jgi:hypothetical protein
MDQTKVFRGYSLFGFLHLDWSFTKEHLQIFLNTDDSNAQTLNAELLSFVAAPFQPARLARISSAGKQRSSDSRLIPSLIYSEIFSTFSLGKFQFFEKVINISNATPELLQLELSWGPGVRVTPAAYPRLFELLHVYIQRTGQKSHCVNRCVNTLWGHHNALF